MDCEGTDKDKPCKDKAYTTCEYRENGNQIVKNHCGRHALKTMVYCGENWLVYKSEKLIKD